jgi:hypothetical protein
MFPGAENRICIFGGLSTGNKRAHLNDLWMFDVASRLWTVENSEDQKAEWPSPRSNTAVWVGEHGQVWLFGGYATIADGDVLGDLWLLSA